MNDDKRVFSRRQMLSLGVAGLGIAGVLGRTLTQGQERLLTPRVTMGPFYPTVKPLDHDADLTMVNGGSGRAQGEIINVMGRVLDRNGSPVSGAKIEIWQANTHGRYSHPSDTSQAPLDPNFQGYALLATDAQGRFRFKTIKPGAYSVSPTSRRTPHIHFEVSGRRDRLDTQMFFPGESLNDEDAIFQALGSEKQAALSKLHPPTGEIEPDSLVFVYDIVLSKG